MEKILKIFKQWLKKQTKVSTLLIRIISYSILIYCYYFKINIREKVNSIVTYILINKETILHYFKVTTISLIIINTIVLTIVFIVAYFTIGLDGIEEKIDKGEGLFIKLIKYLLVKITPF